MKKIDIILALITGEVTAWFFYGLSKTLKIDLGFLVWVFFILFPLLTLFGLWISFLIGRKFLFVFQMAKFLLVGVLASVVDLGVFNAFLLLSGIASGFYASVFKGISFIVATFSKYFGDKFWAFKKMEKAEMEKEFSQFFVVTLIGAGINVGLFSLIVNTLGPQLEIGEKIWANIGAILAVIITATWNFLGYKFIVFKK